MRWWLWDWSNCMKWVSGEESSSWAFGAHCSKHTSSCLFLLTLLHSPVQLLSHPKNPDASIIFIFSVSALNSTFSLHDLVDVIIEKRRLWDTTVSRKGRLDALCDAFAMRLWAFSCEVPKMTVWGKPAWDPLLSFVCHFPRSWQCWDHRLPQGSGNVHPAGALAIFNNAERAEAETVKSPALGCMGES